MPIKTPDKKNVEEDIQEISDIEPKTEIKITTPSGASIILLNQSEADFYNNIAQQYQEHNKFSNISDLLELDRILSMEVMCFRWSTWILREQDYDGNPVPPDLQKNVKEWSREIRDTKSGLGIDKKTREAGKGESPADYIKTLVKRGGEFAVHRNNQVIRAHTILKELQAKITLYKNSKPSERSEFNAHAEDIFEWLDEMFKEFDEIDNAFREEQRIWIREELN